MGVDIGWVIGLLVFLLIACIVVWAARAIMRAWGIGDPIATTVYVVLVVLLALALLSRLGGIVHL